jgi:12-oxophytodienoic acid reductase
VPCRYLVEQLNKYGLAYVHMVEDRVGGNDDKPATSNTLEPFRKVGV